MPEPAPAASISTTDQVPLSDLPAPADPNAEDLSDAELERRRRLEYEEEDEEAPAVEEKQMQYADVMLPKLPMATEKQKVRARPDV